MGDAGRKLAIVLTAVGLTVAPALSANQINLPDMGSPADAVLSKNEENRIGRAIMAQIRSSGEVVDDPQVTEYINEIGYRIAAQANVDGKHEFTFFVVDSPVVNAFALPGGFIGVHTGLLEATRTEDELAGVLAHEVAHVTQRHIARRIHSTQRQSILSTAIMLGAILAGAAGGASSDVMQGAIAVAQGTAAQQQINFTRANEYEADRVGISALAAAGFDPQGMASFFEVISRGTTPHEFRVPEFLRTHPVSSARIAEARGRARNYEPVHTADAQLATEAIAESMRTFERARELFPRNLPLTIHFAEALLRIGEAEQAHDMLFDLLNVVPPTPEQVRLIAKAAIEAGEIAEAHYYMAEYRLMIGDLVGGINFLQQALRVPELEEIQRIRFEARIDFIREFMSEEQLQRLQRS